VLEAGQQRLAARAQIPPQNRLHLLPRHGRRLGLQQAEHPTRVLGQVGLEVAHDLPHLHGQPLELAQALGQRLDPAQIVLAQRRIGAASAERKHLRGQAGAAAEQTREAREAAAGTAVGLPLERAGEALESIVRVRCHRPSSVPLRVYAWMQGACGDGICEIGESEPCGCVADRPSAAWGDWQTDAAP
jgi:hypothetical protein